MNRNTWERSEGSSTKRTIGYEALTDAVSGRGYLLDMWFLLVPALADVPTDRLLDNLERYDEPWALIARGQLLEARAPDAARALYERARSKSGPSGVDMGSVRVSAPLRLPTPVVVPLTDEPLHETLGRTEPVSFDLDGDGLLTEWGWLDPAGAWLVWEQDVTSGEQLFGTFTWGVRWRHGYHPLMALDDDGNLWLEGDELVGLGLWTDTDQDGVWSADEHMALADVGIDGVGLRFVDSWPLPAMAHQGVRFADGRVRETIDMTLLSTHWDEGFATHSHSLSAELLWLLEQPPELMGGLASSPPPGVTR